MTYTVHEIFLTQQGEGVNLGRTCVFVRFAGCNLWSGREADRAAAICNFCDTDFVDGRRYGRLELAATAAALWRGRDKRFCVLTGGEPLLQVDKELVDMLKDQGFVIAVETNGTRALPCALDWVCCSPKAGAPLALEHADELKLVYPQPGLSPADLGGFRAAVRWLSPMDGPDIVANTEAAGAYCLAHPDWRLAIQAHKHWGVR